jgi:HD-like signal output (HDOD) protein
VTDTITIHHLLEQAAEDLEPLPAAAVQLASIVAQPDAGPDEISAVLGTDPALAAHVLREANSAFSASTATIGALDQAVVRIGAARVLEVAIRGQLGARLEQGLDLYELEGSERRRLAVGASLAAMVISKASAQPVSRDVVCAALLHGIGMDVIDVVADPGSAGSLRRAGVPTRELELELVSADHAEVGGFVLRRWGLPATLVDAVEHQHHPDASLEAAVVCLAIDMAADALFGSHGDTLDQATIDAAQALGVADRLDDIRGKVRSAIEADGLLAGD